MAYLAKLFRVDNLLPTDISKPKRYFEANKIVCPPVFDVEVQNACPNDYIIYRNEYTKLQKKPDVPHIPV
jgi:hypothetical protein